MAVYAFRQGPGTLQNKLRFKSILFFLGLCLTLGMFVINFFPGQAVAGSGTADIPVRTPAWAVAINPVTNRIYAADANNNSVQVIDAAGPNSTTIPMNTPYAVAVNPITNKIYVINQLHNSVTVIDGLTHHIITIPVGNAPNAVAVNSLTNKIYITNGASNDVTVIDGSNDNRVTTIPAGEQPYAIAINLATNKIYITNLSGNYVTVIDGSTNTAAAIPTNDDPCNVVINPATGEVDLVNLKNNTISALPEPEAQAKLLKALNTPPVIAGEPTTGVNANTYYEFVPKVEDPDGGDKLSFGIINKPDWAGFNPATGALTGTPTRADAGTTAGIIITVTDLAGANASLPPFDLTVTPKDGLAVDFGDQGVYYYDGQNWTRLVQVQVRYLSTYNHKLVVDAGSKYGLYEYNGREWKQISNSYPDLGANPFMAYQNGLVVNFGTLGLQYYNGTSWFKLADAQVKNLGVYNDKLVADAGSYGIYEYNGLGWNQISSLSIDSSGNPFIAYQNGLAVNFGTLGLQYYNGTSWLKLAEAQVEGLGVYNDKLVADAGSYGLYEYNGLAWNQISNLDADNTGNTFVAYKDGLVVDFGAQGLQYYNGQSWITLTPLNVEYMHVYGDKLVVDAGPKYGFYAYDGKSWRQINLLNANNTGNTMISVDLSD